MPPVILLAVIAGLPLVLVTLLRIKPLYLFVSIVAGYFWVQFLGDPAELVLRSTVHFNNPDVVARIFLLLLPFALTLLLMRKSLSPSALPFQFTLLVADSLLLAELLVPLLTPGVQGAIGQSHAGQIFNQSHDVVISAVAGLHVLVMWVMRPRHHDEHGHHKKKH